MRFPWTGQQDRSKGHDVSLAKSESTDRARTSEGQRLQWVNVRLLPSHQVPRRKSHTDGGSKIMQGTDDMAKQGPAHWRLRETSISRFCKQG